MRLEQILKYLDDVIKRIADHGGLISDDTPQYLVDELGYLSGELAQYDFEGLRAAWPAFGDDYREFDRWDE